MNRKEIIGELEKLIKEAKKNDDTLPIAGILHAVVAAMYSGMEIPLCNLTAEFSKSMIAILTQPMNQTSH